MAVINKSIKIKASPKKVFDFVTTPENWTHYVTSLVAVTDLSSNAPEAGSTFKWQYRVMGVKFKGKGEVTEYKKNKRFGLSMGGKATIKEDYEFIKGENGDTTLNVRIEHETPVKALDFISNMKIFNKLNSVEAKHILDKIKVYCEG